MALTLESSQELTHQHHFLTSRRLTKMSASYQQVLARQKFITLSSPILAQVANYLALSCNFINPPALDNTQCPLFPHNDEKIVRRAVL
jgi:hypothetical protein